ncbi:MAG: hypothetical protein HY236_00620, partial [Acidobacteria bacterium]|nr:hypothetical protein [Acidobacteriota bacterium]
GAEDLDDYGSWAPVPGYGPTWFPRVDAGWAPYSYGRWAWVDWYGWTWVDYDPWGWAPFHYGRWFWRAGFGWGWCPGPIYAPVYWSPALVGFFGWGGHGGFGVGFGFGNIGWVPLAPGERFYPWYGRGFYGRRNNVFVDNSVHITNITNVTNIRNVYRNANVNGGVLSANVQDFSHGRLAHVQHVNVTEIHSAGQIRGVVPVVPDRASLRVSDREVRPGSVPVAAHYDNRFFTRTQSRPVERVPFAEQQQQLTRSFHGQAGPAAQQVNRSPAPAAATGSVRPTAPAPTNPSRSWRRIGEERPPAANAALSAPLADERKAQQDTSGRRLGDGQQAPAAAPAPAPSNYRNADRNSGSRRFGEETRPAPAAAPSAPSPERNAERDSGSRRFGQADHQAAPSRPPAQNYQPRQETPRMERRPLELNRPIVRERAPQHGGGGRSSAPPPRSSGRDSERSSDHGGRGRR